MLTTAAMKRRPTSPGEMLLEEFLKPAGITQLALAKKMAVPIQRVNGIIAGRRAVTTETAIPLASARYHASAVAELAGCRGSLGRAAAARLPRRAV